MKPKLSELYADSKEVHNLTLIAGRYGLSGEISWVHIMEDVNTIDFLRGNELVITTGISVRDDNNWICKLAKSLIEKNCSGLILNIGNYIQSKHITHELVNLCESNNFPLFTMPWRIHIIDLMQDYCNKIFVNTYLDKTLDKLFQTLIFNPSGNDNMLSLLSEGGYDTDSPCCVALFSHLSTMLSVSTLLKRFDVNYHIFLKNDLHIAILSNVTYELLDEFLKQFHSYLESALSVNPSISRPVIGISDIAEGMTQLHFCYIEALHSLNFAERNNKQSQYFKDMGIFRILLYVDNVNLLHRFFHDALKPLFEYDKRNNSDLVETLRIYLQNDGSVQETAKAIFAHRNTVSYRLNRIRSLIGNDLSTADDRFHMRLVFYVKELFEFLDM
ncbi:MAG: PucR family transcriptional regulator ligand-binding domain-containing protein [Clostridiales Family XIII bacterium]|jgi:hypothetical protein|nr:PucR family transcriptional regulator ligand-binding domain-containing protein [Clostridiales Family XIII bacterium]